jgi:HTH-type transcriptional regulator / antitoxin HigA
MTPAQIAQTKNAWPAVAATLRVPHTEADYKELTSLLDSLGEDENHPLASLMEVISVLVERYEDERVPEMKA